MATHAPHFHAAATEAGLQLEANVKLPWLTRHGHLAPAVREALPPWATTALDDILDALNGDPTALSAKTRGAMTADFLLLPHGIQVEYDEVQHFTTARITTLDLYPAEVPLSFDPAAYRAIVERWRSQGDKGFAHREAAEFPGRGGRQRQRAYFDAFRDLAATHFGNGPVLRIPAPANDYVAAVRDLARMASALHVAGGSGTGTRLPR